MFEIRIDATDLAKSVPNNTVMFYCVRFIICKLQLLTFSVVLYPNWTLWIQITIVVCKNVNLDRMSLSYSMELYHTDRVDDSSFLYTTSFRWYSDLSEWSSFLSLFKNSWLFWDLITPEVCSLQSLYISHLGRLVFLGWGHTWGIYSLILEE